MPNKDPSLIQLIWLAISNSASIQGAIMAIVIAILRVLYDNQEPKPIRILLEALLCGALSLCATSIVEFLGLPLSASIAVGGSIGFIGVNSLRESLIKLLERWTDKK